jgi:PAS domain-containing protein
VSLDPALAAHAVAAAGDAIVTLDHGAKVTSWNKAAEELLGFSREEAMQQGLGLSLGLLAGRDDQPAGVVGVLRPLGDAAVEFVTRGEGGA